MTTVYSDDEKDFGGSQIFQTASQQTACKSSLILQVLMKEKRRLEIIRADENAGGVAHDDQINSKKEVRRFQDPPRILNLIRSEHNMIFPGRVC